jgi:hypothetical protein
MQHGVCLVTIDTVGVHARHTRGMHAIQRRLGRAATAWKSVQIIALGASRHRHDDRGGRCADPAGHIRADFDENRSLMRRTELADTSELK